MNNFHNFLIAHRGESTDAPENTLASINLAWERNIKAVEIDIRLTADNQIVVIHDKNTFRVSGKWLNVSKSTLKKLKTLDVGSSKNKNWKGEKIPSLLEVLDTVPQDGRLIIEIKSKRFNLNYLKNTLQECKLNHSQVEIISFHRKVLERAKQTIPQHKTLWLLNLDYFWPHWMICFYPKKIIHKIKKSNLDGVNLWSGKLITKQVISDFKQEGLLVYFWTTNNFMKAKQLIEYGADGIISDKASLLLSAFNKNQHNG